MIVSKWREASWKAPWVVWHIKLRVGIKRHLVGIRRSVGIIVVEEIVRHVGAISLVRGEQRNTKAWSSGKCWSHIQNWCSNLGIWLHYCWKWNESDLRVDICGCGQIQYLWFKHVTGLCFKGFNSESCERFLLDQIAWFGFSDNFGSWFSVTFNFIL